MKTIRSIRENIKNLKKSRNYLACFVVQATYFESLIRAYAEARTKTTLSFTKESKVIIETISNEVTKNKISNLVEILQKCGWLETKTKSKIIEYFKFRNLVMHKLARQVRGNSFTIELKNRISDGENLMLLPVFSNTNTILAASDERRFIYGHGKIFGGGDIDEEAIRQVLELSLSGKSVSEISKKVRLEENLVKNITLNKLATQIEFTIKLKSIAKQSESKKVKSVLKQVAEILDINENDILRKSRSAQKVFARHITMYILNKRLKLSFPKTAKALKRIDHTTAISAVEKVEGLIKAGKVKFLFK